MRRYGKRATAVAAILVVLVAGILVARSFFVHEDVAGDKPIRVNCGGARDYKDASGHIWLKDQPYSTGNWGYLNGKTREVKGDIKNTKMDALFHTQRYDTSLAYRFDNLGVGVYKVRLYFAELALTAPSERVFSVTFNEKLMMSDYDIVSADGAMTAVVKEFIVTAAEGKLEITASAVTGDGVLNMIEILPASQLKMQPVVPSIPDGASAAEGQLLELYSLKGAVIYYTTDGSDPEASNTGKRYRKPFAIGKDTVIKAYAVRKGFAQGDVSTFTYSTLPAVPPTEGCGKGGRYEIHLTGDGWKLWLDEKAEWEKDTLYLPSEVYLPQMPVNAPTVGWDEMYSTKGMDVSVPATVEEYFGNGNNSYTYHGVSWFWKTVDIPADWAGKTVKIQVEKARMRAEIYINEKLAGYDIVAETPFAFDISPYLHYGQSNKIAIRITNPGGERGWQDTHLIRWGDYTFASSHDFGGIGGDVTLVATSNTYIEDVFIKNLLPAGERNIEITATINNRQNREVPLTLTVNIYPYDGGDSVYTGNFKLKARGYTPSLTGYNTSVFSEQITVAGAKLWDVDTPNLYYAEVTIKSHSGVRDVVKQRFGFRTFEVKAVEGEHNTYFNGKRLRHRSAIDWGFYTPGGNYATEETARKSVQAAKDIGHNGINFHRRIGEPLVLRYADEMGLYMYEEPGGFHIHQGENMTASPFAVEIMKEKITRMVIRDRNSPSLIWYNLCNEDNDDKNEARMWALNAIAALDGTRMVTNSSQDDNLRLGHIKHIRPYETEIRTDFYDLHTIQNDARFNDNLVFGLNKTSDDSRVWYWGESGCFTGPSNWYEVAEAQKDFGEARTIYDFNIYKPLHDKIAEYFTDHDLANTGSRVIQSPGDVSVQAGRGLMYADGRIGQSTMIYDSQDGFAINGWSNGPQLPDDWDSAICDEGRNLKGPASDYAYWVRDLQIVIRRLNGKYFNAEDTAIFDIHLINEGKIPAGTYTLKLRVKDGAGDYTSYSHEISVQVAGGETYGQKLVDALSIPMEKSWKGGYITLEGKLYDDNSKEVADGGEQVLLRNRPSYKADIAGLQGAVCGWPAAKAAIADTGVAVSDYADSLGRQDYIAAGAAPDTKTLEYIVGVQ